MCTAISMRTQEKEKKHYFGRNLDLSYSYQESVAITPRNYPFDFRREGRREQHFALIGVAYVLKDYPLYYDGMNEKGLAMAGLNFPGNAFYRPCDEEGSGERDAKYQIAPFELIPWVLSQCENVKEAKTLLAETELLDLRFTEELPNTPLHWMISDREESIAVEAMQDGMKIYSNPSEVLTNNPPFPYQEMNLKNYQNLRAEEPDYETYCVGMGALGLPGDLSSMSRFVRAAFTLKNQIPKDTEEDCLSQFFHVLDSVAFTRGTCRIPKKDGSGQDEKVQSQPPEDYEMTVYSSCMNTEKGIYYYKTYGNSSITAVDLYREKLDGSTLASYPLRKELRVLFEN